MQLKCPTCGQVVPPANINIHTMTALCDSCGSVFSFQSGGRVSSKGKKQAFSQPKYITTEQTPDALNIRIKWSWRTEYPGAIIALVIAAIFAFGFLWLTPARVVTTGAVAAVTATAFNPVMFIFLASMALPFYVLLTLLFNSTHIRLDREKLTRRGGPLPWFYQVYRAVDTSRIVAFEARPIAVTQNAQKRQAMYNIYALLDSDEEVLFLRGFNYAQSHYVMQELESQLAFFDSEDNFIDDSETLGDAMPLDKLNGPLIDGELPLHDDSPRAKKRSDR